MTWPAPFADYGGVIVPMSWRTTGDRRRFLRFDVFGALSASLSSTETLRIVNLGVRGALVEAPLALETDAQYAMRFVLDSHVSDVRVRVRRVTEIQRDSHRARYLIGLEFLRLSTEAEESIGRLVALAGGEG